MSRDDDTPGMGCAQPRTTPAGVAAAAELSSAREEPSTAAATPPGSDLTGGPRLPGVSPLDKLGAQPRVTWL